MSQNSDLYYKKYIKYKSKYLELKGGGEINLTLVNGTLPYKFTDNSFYTLQGKFPLTDYTDLNKNSKKSYSIINTQGEKQTVYLAGFDVSCEEKNLLKHGPCTLRFNTKKPINNK